ncbi:MAG: alpha/beta fold hydrolase [Patescibacteria group bacterium]
MSFVDEFIKKHPEKTLKISNVIGKYISGGESTTGFLIFPGGGQDMYSSYDLIETYENKYKVISLSITGFFDLKTFFLFINKILEVEKVNRVIVYGLSLGGFIAQHYVKANKKKVIKLILSHTATTKSKPVIKKVMIPGKILHFFLPIIPITLLRYLVKKNAGRIQAGHSNTLDLWNKYTSKFNLKKREEFINRFGLDFLNREYLNSFYRLGTNMEKEERGWDTDDLNDWSKNILIIKAIDDPLAQDDGMLKKYYPKAKEYIFNGTGHLTPFIQFKKMKRIIDDFISTSK